ncbi:hypothetical protein [Clostridium tarantellae]|uniref:Lipoprotein n=1 Tax=Clostridium tarantellae TaxID=39493 RepID=A0A6I1MML5_9CLOT|nr:hypothetical protein [Clostridium tarantellae]MPQ44635.1 hypothetical protein [Clostridium tarantellae]
MKKCLGISLIVLSFLIFFLIGCKNSLTDKNKINEIKSLPNNLVLQFKNNTLTYESVHNGKLTNVDIGIEGEIRAFNKEKNFLIYTKVENFQTQLNIVKNNTELNYNIDGSVEKIWVNNSCEKVFYKINHNNEFIDYFIIDLNKKENKKLNEDIIISGDIVDFLDNNNLILYGVNSKEKISGIYIYNLESESYSLMEQVTKAFIDYIKVLDENKILYGKSFFDNKKECYIYNINTKTSKQISSNIKIIKNILFIDNKVYFIGEGNESSKVTLYCLDINSEILKRLIFDFPRNVDKNSKLLYENGQIIFTGYTDSQDKAGVYSYNLKNKSIKLISDVDGKYIII